MSQPSIVEKLHLSEERNLLIQGLPSSIEKQFAKLSFSKNVTPLLRSKKIDWALIFAVNENQLNNILKDVLPALHEESKLWVAYPKSTSKITSDLNRDCSWSTLTGNGYEGVVQVALDHVWSALWWKKGENGNDHEEISIESLEETLAGA
jgi:hypothetical protein